MNLAIATDFNGSQGSPRESLKAIAEAGFTHLHWCHQWCTDFLYSKYEISQIHDWLKEFGLRLLDIHGSAGQEKLWYADEEYRRRSGVELVENRIHMLRELDGEGTLMMHIPAFSATAPERRETTARLLGNVKRSLDELMPVLEKEDVLIAVENMWNDTFEGICDVLNAYPKNRLGLCYDSGHANSSQVNGMDSLAKISDRLEALHLHDNNGSGDQHQPPFFGNVNWERLAGIIATSSYSRVISFELSMANTPFFDRDVKGPQGPEMVKKFLADAYVRCEKFAKMVGK